MILRMNGFHVCFSFMEKATHRCQSLRITHQLMIDTFGFGLDPKSYAYQGRSKYSDIPGTLFSDSNGWVIKTDSPPDACNGIGADFSKSPSDANFSRYYIVEKLNALEIGVVVRKH